MSYEFSSPYGCGIVELERTADLIEQMAAEFGGCIPEGAVQEICKGIRYRADRIREIETREGYAE